MLAYMEGIAGNTAFVDDVVGGLYIGKAIDDAEVPKILRKCKEKGKQEITALCKVQRIKC